MQSIFLKAEELKNQQKRGAVCIVVDTTGSTPRKHGSKMVVFDDGTIYGSIGGGSVEKEVAEKALSLIAGGIPAKLTFNLEDDLGMHCGGTMEVYIEPIIPSQKLLIFGGGHIGKAIALFAKELDFSIHIIDPRPGIFTEEMLRDHHCINEDYFKAIEEFPFDENTYCVIVTPKHLFDEEILGKIARKPHAYVGMLGSSRKVAMARQRFLDEKVLTKEELDAVDMPIGIKFRVQTPQEIAVSILAKLIDVRNSMTNSNS